MIILHTGPGAKPSPVKASSAEAPLATLEGARDAVRGMDSLPEDGVAITLQEGTYRRTSTFRLAEEDSGTESSPIVYRGADSGDVTITGGVTVAGDKFSSDLPDEVANRLPEAAQDEVVMLDLEEVGIEEYGAIKGRNNESYGEKTTPVELFADGERQTLARYPNNGFTYNTDGWRWSPKTGVPVNYVDERPETWESIDDVWINIQGRASYTHDRVSIAEIDPANNQFITTRYGRSMVKAVTWVSHRNHPQKC